MTSLSDTAWLIPASPLFGAFIVGLLLVNFNRTINRLTKPISFLMGLAMGIVLVALTHFAMAGI